MKTAASFGSLSTLALLFFAFTTAAHADTTTVLGTDSVYNAGTSASSVGGGATNPTAIAITPGATYFTFSSSTGATVTVNGGGSYNDADGVGSASGETDFGTSTLSGITTPTAGFIAGVFLTAGGPLGTAPAALNFTGAGGTSFATLSPLLDQAFFVGDGLTGDATGATQKFYIPTGATELYLGLTDACGYYGGPGCYGDNVGSFTVNFAENGVVTPPTPPVTTATPEPSSLLLLGSGALGAIGALRRRLAL